MKSVLRHFRVHTDKVNYVVQSEINRNVLSALESHSDIYNKMAEMRTKHVLYLIGKTKINGYINLGMPLKCLPEDSNTEMKFFNMNENEISDVYYREDAGKEDWVLFYICPLGFRGAQSRRITKYKCFDNNCYLCVFAPKGETIKDALCNDGRFLPLLDKGGWSLQECCCLENKVLWINSLAVDQSLAEKKFTVNWSGQQRGTKDSGGPHKEQNVQASHELKTVSLGTCDVPNKEQIPPALLGETTESQAQTCSNMVSHKKYLIELRSEPKHLYPFFWEQCNIINSSFEKTRAGKKQEKEFLIARKEEFDKVTKNSSLIKTHKILIELSESVGYIVWGYTGKEGSATCLVLCNRYILTCRHVVDKIVGEGIDENLWRNKISESARVIFSYEDKHPKDSDSFYLEPWLGITNGQLDFAVLRLQENEKIPKGLVHLSSPPPSNGLIYIIGHPEGEAKSMDGCSVVSITKREMECSWRLLKEKECNKSNFGINSIHLYTPRSFSDIINNPHKVTYDTTFFHGSSGSPVFDQNGKLVALHTGGYVYGSEKNKRNIIEYGFLIISILSEIEKEDKAWYNSEILPFTVKCPDRAEATLPSHCSDVEMEECS